MKPGAFKLRVSTGFNLYSPHLERAYQAQGGVPQPEAEQRAAANLARAGANGLAALAARLPFHIVVIFLPLFIASIANSSSSDDDSG